MRVAMLTAGTRGDTQPVVALGSELRRRGHEVTVATHEPFRPFVEGRGLRFAPLPGDPRSVLETPEGRRLVGTGPSIFRFARRFLSLLRPWFDDLTTSAARACADAEAILYTPLTFVGWHLAEARGVPSAMTALQPLEPTSSWSAVTLGGRDLGGPLNELSHRVVRQMSWQLLRRPVRRWREELGLPPGSWLGPFRRLRTEGHLQLYGYSPSVVPVPPDWPTHVLVTGYWFLDEPKDWSPPSDLVAYLAGGPPPLYVGFGSMSGTDHVTAMAIRAARAAGARVVVAGDPDAGDDDVMAISDVPHSWLMPRVAGSIHHGGAGTTAAALRAGVPAVILPGYADQPFWARRVHELGAGPAPISMGQVTESRLTGAIAALPDHAPHAQAAAAALAREDGTAAAADAIASLGDAGSGGLRRRGRE